MPFLIDGHNLIPKLGLRLDSIDDEMELVAILQEFCRLERRELEVYFDGAPPVHAGTRRIGAVKAHFIRKGRTADSAIRARLQELGRAARSWTVVSSDREILDAAAEARAAALTSEEFVQRMRRSLPGASSDREPAAPSAREVEQWLREFDQRGRREG